MKHFLLFFLPMLCIFFLSAGLSAITSAEVLTKEEALAKADLTNKQALEYLEKLREKEYLALKRLCLAGGISAEDTQKVIQFSKDFRNIHAKKFFSQKNPDFFHDPKLAEFKMGDSNVLEETKKILRECGINPESISIRYQERPLGEKEPMLQETYTFLSKLPNPLVHLLDKIYKKVFSLETGCGAYVKFAEHYLSQILKEAQESTIDNIIEKLNPQRFHQEMVITKRGVTINYSSFRHLIRHEISHLLEGHVIMYALFFYFKEEKNNNNEIFEKLFNAYRYRQEVIADVRRYFDFSDSHHLLNALRVHRIFFGEGKTDEVHPSCKSTYKRLQKINQLTHKIPFYKYLHYELGRNVLKVFLATVTAEAVICSCVLGLLVGMDKLKLTLIH